ncbi:iron chelate uptake ABC transporter family permease subunit [Haematomicrobium sanguinis]|uniref:iron chelate uptake ABC transporter family permease subunit n=1 Tax=Haematomicrobium sanguinis TaxID=479106 RepID=UPI0004786DBA
MSLKTSARPLPGPAAASLPSPHLRALRLKERRSRMWRLASLAVLALALLACSILLGNFTVTVPDFFRLLFGSDIPGATFIVMEVKLPRALLGALVGIMFALAGTIFQTMLRNPLASPDIIGISSGASASAVIAIVFFGATGALLSTAAIAGALILALTITWLAGRDNGNRLILMGIGVAAMMQALIVFVMQRADYQFAQQAIVWLAGSLSAATWERLSWVALGALILLPATGYLSHKLRALELGPDLAAGLGVNVARTRLALIVTAVALAAIATAATGPIAFVAFLAGPIASRIMGGRTSFIASALVGVSIVLAADYIGANMLGALVLPVGVITGAAGAPFLLAFLARGAKKS